MLPLPFFRPGTLSIACQIAVTGFGARRNAPHTPSSEIRFDVYSVGCDGELASCGVSYRKGARARQLREADSPRR